jgi:hypothetical protein
MSRKVHTPEQIIFKLFCVIFPTGIDRADSGGGGLNAMIFTGLVSVGAVKLLYLQTSKLQIRNIHRPHIVFGKTCSFKIRAVSA